MSRPRTDNAQFNVVYFDKPVDLGSISGSTTISSLSNKITKIVMTDVTVLNLPAMTSDETVSIMLMVKQDATGGRTLTIYGDGSIEAINLSEFDFSSGTANQICYVTLLWDSERWAFTTSRWFD